MSIQAGIWNLDGTPVKRDSISRCSHILDEYGTSEGTELLDGPIGLLYRPFHSTAESRLERQPYVSSDGRVFLWDGRLDNRDELISQLRDFLTNDKTDVAIMAAGFDRWGNNSFSKLRGDWAVSIWCLKENQLILARDYVGIRQLFYYLLPKRLLWCSYLAALALCGDQFTLCDEYIAGYLALHPDGHLTPYREIRSVPPGSFVTLFEGRDSVKRYWKLNVKLSIRYKTDGEYQEHYRHLFRQAVRRRLRTDSPVLADLSGGLDSSSIVCMADEITVHEGANTGRLDTFSFYDLNEPDEDDFRHLSKVEEKRGRKGFHVDLDSPSSESLFEYPNFTASPQFGDRAGTLNALSKIVKEGGYKVLLSGTGGDEINGQALDPRIVVAELFLRLRWIEMAKHLTVWSLLIRKRPWIQLLLESLLNLAPASLRSRLAEQGQPAPFVDPIFARKHNISARQVEAMSGLTWLRPGIRDALQTITTLSRRFTTAPPSFVERRYPYLDQDLVEFLAAIPLDQLQRSGQRRFLMRRALTGIVPDEILERETKSRIGRCYCLLAQAEWPRLVSTFSSPVSVSLGYLDREHLWRALVDLKNGQVTKYALILLRAVALEFWLRDACARNVLSIPDVHVAATGAVTGNHMHPQLLLRNEERR